MLIWSHYEKDLQILWPTTNVASPALALVLTRRGTLGGRIRGEFPVDRRPFTDRIKTTVISQKLKRSTLLL